jgi:hypothetical protein
VVPVVLTGLFVVTLVWTGLVSVLVVLSDNFAAFVPIKVNVGTVS